jgi:hypothetical protein
MRRRARSSPGPRRQSRAHPRWRPRGARVQTTFRRSCSRRSRFPQLSRLLTSSTCGSRWRRARLQRSCRRLWRPLPTLRRPSHARGSSFAQSRARGLVHRAVLRLSRPGEPTSVLPRRQPSSRHPAPRRSSAQRARSVPRRRLTTSAPSTGVERRRGVGTWTFLGSPSVRKRDRRLSLTDRFPSSRPRLSLRRRQRTRRGCLWPSRSPARPWSPCCSSSGVGGAPAQRLRRPLV